MISQGVNTSIGEALDEGPNQAHARTEHDRPSSSDSLVEVGDKRQRENSSEGVCGSQKALEVCFDRILGASIHDLPSWMTEI